MRILFLLLCIFLITGCGTTTSPKAKNEPEHVKTDLRSPEKKFIEDKMDSLIKSTSSLIDLTWKTTVSDSVDNFQFGLLSAESTVSDLELSKKQFNNKIKEIENFKIPNELDFKDEANLFISETLKSLSNAIQGRIDIIDYLIESVNANEVNEKTAQDIESRLIVSNASLQLAAKSYGLVFENVD
ncbi:hypothetical protein [Paenibacillus sp. IITD108]|uniref:hypothetical protein n=1 Tax=Paenibacillus sp. IITD108 TaxID=3116649 RepID=UPI002F3FBEBA